MNCIFTIHEIIPLGKQLNVLHISAVRNWGGGENHIENLCDELGNMDHSVNNILLCVRNTSFHRKLNGKNLGVHTAPMTIKLDPRFTFKIIWLCKKYHIDLVHIHDSTALTLAVMATKLGKLPPFIFSKKTSFPIKSRSRTLYKYNHSQIQRVLCVSEKTKVITAKSVKDTDKLKVVYHGTRLNQKINSEINLKEYFNIPDSKIIVGTIANHIRAKNLETWVKMIDHLVNKRNIRNFHFVQIGNHTSRTPTYLESIKNLGLQQYVSFTGFVENASGLIPQFDISLLTSQSEGLPQFIYESSFHKVPVVSTNVGGIPEFLEDGENGMLTNPYEPQSLADKLIALSRDKELSEKFTERSYNKLIENFTTRKMAEQTLAEYKNVLYGTNRSGS